MYILISPPSCLPPTLLIPLVCLILSQIKHVLAFYMLCQGYMEKKATIMKVLFIKNSYLSTTVFFEEYILLTWQG